MSEFNHFKINYVSDEGPGQFDCVPEDTELWLHGENYRDVDHIFHRISSVDRRLGAFAWRHVLGEGFDGIADRMMESQNWVCHFYPVPSESDMAQFAHEQLDIPDSLPDSFN